MFRNRQRLWWTVLAIVILPVFGLPSAALLFGDRDRDAAVGLAWGTHEISRSQYQLWKRRWLQPRAFVSRNRDDYSEEDLQAHIVLVHEALDAGVQVTAAEASDFIKAAVTNPGESPAFRDPFFADRMGFYYDVCIQLHQAMRQRGAPAPADGRSPAPWVPEIYAQFLQGLQLSATEFEEGIREDLIVTRLRKLLERTNIVGSQSVYDKVAKQQEQVKVEWVLANAAQFMDEVKRTPPTDAQLQDHYRVFQKRYEIPETRTFEFLAAEVARLEPLMTVSERDIVDYYEAHKEEFRLPDAPPGEKKPGDGAPPPDGATPPAGAPPPAGDKPADAKPADAAPPAGDGKPAGAPDKPAEAPKPGEAAAPADPAKPPAAAAPQVPPGQPAPPIPAPEPTKPGDAPPAAAPEKRYQPLGEVKARIIATIRHERAPRATERVMAEVHRVLSELEGDITAKQGDPLKEIASLDRANFMIGKRPDDFVPDAPSYRLHYDRITEFCSADGLWEWRTALPAHLADRLVLSAPTLDPKTGEPATQVVERDGKTVTEPVLERTEIARTIADESREMLVGRISAVKSVGSARLVVRFLASEPGRIPPFVEIVEKVRADWFEEQAYQRARTLARECHAAVAGGQALAAAATERKLSSGGSDWYKRYEYPAPGLPVGTKDIAEEAVFDLKKDALSVVVDQPTTKAAFFARMLERRKPLPHELSQKLLDDERETQIRDGRTERDARFDEAKQVLALANIRDTTDAPERE